MTMNSNAEDLKQLLVSRYQQLGYFVSYDEDTLYLRFSPESRSPAVMVRVANDPMPLGRMAVQQVFEDMERKAVRNGCHQFRLVNPAGFQPDCRLFENYNLALSDASYLRDMGRPGYLDLFAHNEKMYREICEAHKSVNKVAAVQATGSGKSMLIASSVRDNAGQRQLVVVPRNNIRDEIARHIPADVPVDFITFQKLGLYLVSGKLDSLKYDRIYVDEFHHAGATKWGAAVAGLFANNPKAKILGTTATSMHTHAEKGSRDIAMEMFDKVAGRMNLSDALVRHILRTPDYVCMPSSYDNLRSEMLKDSEIHTDTDKAERINRLVDAWEKDIPLHQVVREKLPGTNCKMIVFSSDITRLKQDKRLIADLMKKAGISYIGYDYYQSGSPRTLEGLDRFKNEKTRTRAQIIFCIDMLNEGVHVPGVQAAFFLRHTESQTVFHQQLGRIMAAGSNDCTVVFDMVDNVYSRNISDLAEEVSVSSREKADILSLPGRPYTDPEPVSFRVDDYLKSFREQKEAVVPRQAGEDFAERLQRIADTYTEDGRIRIRPYNTQARNDEQWFYMQTKKYAFDKLKPEEKALMDRLKFDAYVPPEEKMMAELDRFIRLFRLKERDMSRMSEIDIRFYKRLAARIESNTLELGDYRKLADAGVTFFGYKVPMNYTIAHQFKLDTIEQVMAKLQELSAEKKARSMKTHRKVLTDEQKQQNKLQRVVSGKSEGETYRVGGKERKFGGTRSREELEKLKREAQMSFLTNKPGSSMRRGR